MPKENETKKPKTEKEASGVKKAVTKTAKAVVEKVKSEKKKTDQAKTEKTKAKLEEKSKKADSKQKKTSEEKKVKAETKKDEPKKDSSKPKASKNDTKKTQDKSEKKPEKKSEKKTEKKSSKKTTDSATTEKKTTEKWKIKQLGGMLFAKMMRGGASELRANAEEVNKLNVFPVPDGDTGDNMRMTIESGVASLDNIDTDDLAEVLRVASRGMLLGARGNSGVILSQFFAGMAKGLENVETADAKKLAHALELGVEQAYTSVMTPTEGTILTVARESVEYAVKRLNPKSTVQSLFSDLVKEMQASLERTPEILPVLGEAGVVDSGGAGLLYIIDGLNRVLNGEDLEDTEITPRPVGKGAKIEESSFGPDSVMAYGYCTELLVQLMNKKIEKNPFDIEALKVFLASVGDSVVAFQTETIVKIHVHTMTPEKVLKHMRKFGEFLTVKIENMSVQHTESSSDTVVEEQKPEEIKNDILPKKKYGIAMVSNGDGISNLFKELGADQIVEGGQTNNPSTNDFIDAFGRINAEHIFVFPNNSNIIMAATQAAEIYEQAKVYIIPTKSIGAGYVALTSMNFDFSEPDDLVKEAEEAIERITAAYISPAVRDVEINGVRVTEGDTMGIIAKDIVISGPDRMASIYGLIDILLANGEKFMLTSFCGKDLTAEEKQTLENYMAETYPLVEAYFIDGGQEVYPLLFVAE